MEHFVSNVGLRLEVATCHGSKSLSLRALLAANIRFRADIIPE
jgi:hypothetical protein